MKLYRAQNKNITEIYAGSFFGDLNIVENYVYGEDVVFDITLDNASFCDVAEFSCDIDAGLNDDENLEAVGKYDFLSHDWKQNGGFGETYLSTKNIVLTDIVFYETYVNDNDEEITIYKAKGELKEVSLDEIKKYTSREEYNKR
jgi:hypothetical protein